MPKKFFDIIPPNKDISYSQDKVSKFDKKRSKSPVFFQEKNIFSFFTNKKWQNIKGKILGGILGILILIGLFSYFNFKEARIEIWPQLEVLNFNKEVVINAKLGESSFSTENISGKFLEEEKEAFQQFSSSGIKMIEEKSKGIIRVYNNYHQAISLVADTRFLTSDGELFYLEKRIYIPAGSFIDARIEAAEPGSDYNIKPSTFSVPGLVGYPSYTAVYGKSFSQMSGGSLDNVFQITQDDLEKAENILKERLKKEGRESLENKVETDYILLKKAINQEITEVFSLALVGAEVEKFGFQVKIKSKAIIFKKENLENFVKEFILNQIEPFQKIDEESLEINYSFRSVDLESGKIFLSLEISTKVYSNIDISSIKKVLFGKSLEATRVILENQPQIIKVQVKLWPFWVKRVPEDEEKIKINLRLD